MDQNSGEELYQISNHSDLILMNRMLPNKLEAFITNIYGTNGKKWLADLPNLIEQMEAMYGLSELKTMENLSYNYVLSGFQDAQPIILKLSPDVEGSKREALTLRAFARLGIVKVLAEDAGILLLERAVPGFPLKFYFPTNDNEAIRITCECLKHLHQAPIPSAHTFPNVKDWLKALDADLNIPSHYLLKARQLRDDLLATSSTPVLLHGDLHHDNILQNGNGWIVIDPKGVIGEPAYEVAAFIRNPIPELLALNNLPSIIDHRITRFAEILELPKRRIFDWCFVQAVLAWAWTLEDSSNALAESDGSNETYFKHLTEILEPI